MKKTAVWGVVVCLTSLLFIVGCPWTGTNPAITLVATPNAGVAPLSVELDASLTWGAKYRDPGTVPNFPPLGGVAPAPLCVLLSYTWDFGDGQVVTNFSPTVNYTYNTPGNYTARVTANFLNCPSVSATAAITVAAGQTPPVANAGPDQVVPFGDVSAVNVTLDGTASFDPDDTPRKSIVQYIWTGTPDPEDIPQPTVSLTLGVHTFTLVVVDDDGLQSDPDTVTITVALPPVADAGPDQRIILPVGQNTGEVTLDGSSSYDPMDHGHEKSIVQYIWTGTPDPDNTMQPTLVLGEGEYDFTLVVVSNNGLQSFPDTVHVSVLRPPVADAGDDQVVFLGESNAVDVTLDGTGSFDPTGALAKSIVQYIWTGTPDPEDVAQPTVSLTWGVHTFTLVVVDDDGLQSAPDTVTVTVTGEIAVR
ncbi:MAG TPA: PKD domain-containing protein [Candidatus Hydrogenedentes bacterium]|nr:PKD domain-containing protein [Candidatus Hydrogenedentota bacterium]HOL77902.1 PKD domain-containing protein [Candidatus Hydrogenedentota bacterium]HPO87128.1 PKD domain-containing protein [Candidatus Hydrogenedentota bacterium]